MHLKDVKKGGKYFHALASNTVDKNTGLKVKDSRKVYVLDIDFRNRKVCASINGAPAEWFDGNKYCRWTETDPALSKEQPKLKITNKVPTRPKQIAAILSDGKALTIQEITKRIIINEGLSKEKARGLNGTVGATLKRMIKEKRIKNSTEKGPQGGCTYKTAY